MIYLDNNATTKLSPAVIARMHELMQLSLANPSSQHSEGRKARQILEQARDSILIGCGARTRGMASDQLLFTSGGTEANNLALLGLTESKPGAIVVSAIEHPSILAAAEHAAQHGRSVKYLPCDQQGVVRLQTLAELLDEHDRGQPIALVSLMLANNETGVLQPVDEAAAMCKKAGVPIHTDAVQVLGKLPLDFAKLNVDAMTLSAHKIHGPAGIGALILRHGMQVHPRSFGGFQQMGLRPGTEAPVLAGGFACALSNALEKQRSNAEWMRARRDQLQTVMIAAVEDIYVPGSNVERLPNTLSISFPGVDRQALQLALDLAGIACSTGSACASGSSQPSHVLEAMQLDESIVRGGIRFSVSMDTSPSEIEQVVKSLTDIIPKLRRNRPAKN